MAQTTPPTITAAPAAPVRGTSTFKTAVDAFLTWMSLASAQFIALGANVYANAVDCYNNAVAAAASAASSLAYSNNASASATAAQAAQATNAPLWVSGNTYAQYAVVLSPADNLRMYRRKTASGSGTTDPKSDTTNYVLTTPTSLTLLATITPTAAANVDFLSTFTSLYDNYLIIGSGIKPAADDYMKIRLANAGVVDTAANFGAAPVGASSPNTDTNLQIVGMTTAAGKGAGFSVTVNNCNDTSNGKTLTTVGASQDSATPTWQAVEYFGFYTNSAAVTGIRFYWSGGSNFAATGKIRVYGYQN
jgi:hypothetical protein